MSVKGEAVEHDTSIAEQDGDGGRPGSPREATTGQPDGSDDDQTERIPHEDSGGGGDADGGTEEKREGAVEDIDQVQSVSDIPPSSPDHNRTPTSVGSTSHVSVPKSIQSRSVGEGRESMKTESHGSEESVKKCSAESMSSGFWIVNQILWELIETVVNFKEKDEIELRSQDGQEIIKKSSVTTIKSADEEGSLAIDRELQMQLALELELAALQRQGDFEQNVARYHTLMTSRINLKRKNVFLLKQMFEHYKRKKIEHLFKEIPLTNIDMQGKYARALLTYKEANNTALQEELKMRALVSNLEEKKKSIEFELDKEWNNLLGREREVSRGLIIRQSSKSLSEKQNVDSLIERQIAKSKEVTKERLIYFKLRDIVAADENHLKSLENLGDDFTLMEYEQLKMQSQSCVEKLEERDAELHRLRNKATSAIQILAEVREKIHTLQEEMEAGKEVLHDVNRHLVQTRERVGCEKKRRDMSRSDTVRLRLEAGLLSEPKLLQDYKESLMEKERIIAQLKDWKNKFESQKHSILSLRKELVTLQQ